MKTPLIVAIVFAIVSTAVAADWPEYRGPNRDGITVENNLNTSWGFAGPDRLFSFDAGTGSSSMAIVDGVLYTIGNKRGQDTVYAIDAKSGEVVWEDSYRASVDKRMFEGGPTATPTVSDGIVYTLGHEGQLRAYNAKTGTLGWEKHLTDDFGGKRPRWGYSCSPLIFEDKLIVETGSRKGSLVALDRRTGAVIWQEGKRDIGYSAPVVLSAQDKTAVIFTGYGLTGFALDSGKELFSVLHKTSYDVNAALPVIVGKDILVSSAYGKGATMVSLSSLGKSARASEAWSSNRFQNQFSASVAHDGFVYGFSGNVGSNPAFKCIRLSTGETMWEETGLGVGSVIKVDDHLVILSETGELVLAKPNSARFEELERMQVLGGRSWVSPAYTNGIVYVKNNDGDMAAFDLSK